MGVRLQGLGFPHRCLCFSFLDLMFGLVEHHVPYDAPVVPDFEAQDLIWLVGVVNPKH